MADVNQDSEFPNFGAILVLWWTNISKPPKNSWNMVSDVVQGSKQNCHT